MSSVILVAHGKLAHEMKNSAEMIFGELSDFQTVEFLKEDGFDSLKEKIKAVLNKADESVVILADLFGGTPFNVSCGLAMEFPEKEIEVISGMSLPLVLETATIYADREAKKVVAYLQEIASDTVRTFLIEDDDEE